MTLLTRLSNTAEQAYATAEKVYAVVVQLERSASNVDTRWSSFQDPVIFEDPFGVKLPIPSEYSVGMLDAIVHSKYLTGDIRRDIMSGNIQIYYTDDPNRRLELNEALRPGSTIIMAVVVAEGDFGWKKTRSSANECPRCPGQQQLISIAGQRREWYEVRNFLEREAYACAVLLVD